MPDDFFANRLASLRIEKGVSARDMSLSIGQNASYINRIENKKAYPSMEVFFYICEYLEVSPHDFFCTTTNSPFKHKELLDLIERLDKKQLDIVIALIKELTNHKK